MGEKGRLDGVHVLVTRPRERARELCFLLEEEGAEVSAIPLLELAPPDDPRPLRSAAEQLHRYRWVLFASPSAVAAMVDASRQAGTLDRFARVKLAAVGPATARAIREHGLEPTCEAREATGVGLFDIIRAELRPSDEVLLPAAQDGRRELEQALEDAGIPVTRVAAYRSEKRPIGPEQLAQLERRPPDAVLFASPRTIDAFLEAAGERGRTLLERSRRVAIGPTTASALREHGLEPSAAADRPTPEGLVEATVKAIRG